jgi:uncharacterized protein YxjI
MSYYPNVPAAGAPAQAFGGLGGFGVAAPAGYPAFPDAGGYPGGSPFPASGGFAAPPPSGYPSTTGMAPPMAPHMQAPAGYPPASGGYMQQPGAPLPAGGAAGTGVINPRYVAQQETVLKIVELYGAIRGKEDDFAIFDARTGQQVFKMDSAAYDPKWQRRVLRDAYGAPACCLMKKPMSLSGAWEVYAGGDFAHKLLEVKPKMMSMTPVLAVNEVNDGDRLPDYYADGNFRAKSFDIVRCNPDGSRGAAVATIKAESKWSSGHNYVRAKDNKDTYYARVQPGVDLAFISALCVIIDEVYRDEKDNKQQQQQQQQGTGWAAPPPSMMGSMPGMSSGMGSMPGMSSGMGSMPGMSSGMSSKLQMLSSFLR